MSLISSIVSAVKSLSSQIVAVVVKYNPVKDASSLNFRYGETLAVSQDNIIASIIARRTVSEAQIRMLENDVWIPLAERLAPCNLVIRQLCLIDVLRNKTNNYNRILALLNKVSYKTDVTIPKFSGPGTQQVRIFAEGYSYWEYTMNALTLWIAKFLTTQSAQVTNVRTLVTKIYNGFVATSYKRGTVFYPAPFGDLFDIPLNQQDWQVPHTPVNVTIANVKMNVAGGVVTSYNISSRPLGCNLHTVVNNYTSNIASGRPTNFTYYTGYSVKYRVAGSEIADMLNSTRLSTLAKL